MKLLADCSVSPDTGLGIGGYLLVGESNVPPATLADCVKLKAFDGVSSTELELRTIIWALSDTKGDLDGLHVYTDSQNVLSLIERRGRLEQHDFRNRSGIRLKHASLYQEFYALLDELGFEVRKLKGHRPKKERSDLEMAFSLVDRMTRKELRKRLAS
jgi:ribonuclease HI